jgi:DNA-directed RNA polymerase
VKDGVSHIKPSPLRKSSKFMNLGISISNIKFSINTDVLNYLLKLMSEKESEFNRILGIKEIMDIEVKRDDKEKIKKYYNAKKDKTNSDESKNIVEELQQFVKDYYINKGVIEANKSRTYQVVHLLLLAVLFSKIDYFYIPVFYDFRGRIYCKNKYLHYQGTELAKSLLVFHKPSELNVDNEDIYFRYGVTLFNGGYTDNKSRKMS